MSGRGGRAPSKRPMPAPNLSQAGKREEKGATPASRGVTGQRRGGRGRGRGRGGSRNNDDRPGLIQSEGIFSDGLFQAPKPKKIVDDDGIEKFSARTVREAPANEESTSATSGGAWRGYEAEWASDHEEEDLQELRELMREGFVTDLKRGSVLPLVLPKPDETQFVNLLSKSAKKEILSDGEEDAKPDKTLIQESKFSQLQRAVEEEGDPTLKLSRRAGQLFNRLRTQNSDELMLVQLPSSFEVLGRLTKPKAPESQDPQPDAQASSSSATVPNEEVKPEPAHCLSVFEPGQRIGKLQILRNGRVRLCVDGCEVPLDVTQIDPGQLKQTLVRIETREETGGGDSVQGDASSSKVSGTQDAIHVLGSIKRHLVVSHDFRQLVEAADKAKASQQKQEEEAMDVDAKITAEQQAELQKLEKEARNRNKLAAQWAKEQ